MIIHNGHASARGRRCLHSLGNSQAEWRVSGGYRTSHFVPFPSAFRNQAIFPAANLILGHHQIAPARAMP
jgi:hypothetical protein